MDNDDLSFSQRVTLTFIEAVLPVVMALGFHIWFEHRLELQIFAAKVKNTMSSGKTEAQIEEEVRRLRKEISEWEHRDG